MDVGTVIVEQLDPDGSLRTFRMHAEFGDRITVALADEYDEPRSGPFHFLDDHHEAAFSREFADCKVRRLTTNRFSKNDNQYHFRTSWSGIPTEQHKLSYYAMCLPEYAVPLSIRFTDPRSGREYKKSIVRDDHRRRYVLYLECRSSHGSFDFSLEASFQISPSQFPESTYTDSTTSPYGAHADSYEYLLDSRQNSVVQQFFSETITMGDQYNVGQAGAVGPLSHAENLSFQQVWNQAGSDINLDQLAHELHLLRAAMRKNAIEVSHDKSLAEVAAAEEAAQRKDGPKAIQHLKAAGKWAFDVATKIGTQVAAKAIQVAIGI